MPTVYVMMCDECFSHVKIGDPLEIDLPLEEQKGYNKLCQICGKGAQSATVRCSLIERVGNRFHMTIEGGMKIW